MTINSEKCWCGIDPGKDGGICFISDAFVTILRPPWIKNKTEFDFEAFAQKLRVFDPEFVVIERQGVRHTDGKKSAFTNGYGYGVLEAITSLVIGKNHYDIPLPQEWQAVMHKGIEGGTTKERSFAWCAANYPEVSMVPQGCTKPCHGFADALCIAEYCRRMNE